MWRSLMTLFMLAVMLVPGASPARAADPVVAYSVYDDAFNAGWSQSTVNASAVNTNGAVYSGNQSRKVTLTAGGGSVTFQRQPSQQLDLSPYSHLTFALRNQDVARTIRVTVLGDADVVQAGSFVAKANEWTVYSLALDGTPSRVLSINFQDRLLGNLGKSFFIDRVGFVAKPPTGNPCDGFANPGERRPINTPYHQASYDPTLLQSEKDAFIGGGDFKFPAYYEARIKQSSQACHGTSDQILEWAAVTSGIAAWPEFTDPSRGWEGKNILRAVAWKESGWNTTLNGDLHGDDECLGYRASDPTTGCFGPPTYPDPDYQSHSWVQLKRVYNPNWPGYENSTVYAVDYLTVIYRYLYDGQDWTNGANAGCGWCVIAAYFSGGAGDPNGAYATSVKQILTDKPWLTLPPQ